MNEKAKFKKWLWIAATGWSLLICASFAFNSWQSWQSMLEQGRSEGEMAFLKDLSYRLWNASHGGVYVPVTESTQPNPYLHVPLRDVTTTDGQKLTLINPEHMARLVFTIGAERYGFRGRLTSLNPINPGNAPDAWEKKALQAVEKNRAEITEFLWMDGKPFMRFMRPMITEDVCLKCHREQEYKVGDIHGGISLSVPMSDLVSKAKESIWYLAFAHGAFLILGIFGLIWSNRKITQYFIASLESGEKAKADRIALQQERDMFVSGSVVIFKWKNQENWPVEYVSANVKELLGYTADEFLQGEVLYASLVHPEDIKRVADEVQSYSQSQLERFNHQPYRLIHKNGDVVWVLNYTTILRDEAGNITYYLSYLVDITEWKKSEEALRVSKERLDLVLKGAELGMWDWHIPSGKIVINERWAEMLGYTPEEIEPKLSSWEKLVHPDDLENVKAILTDHMEGRSPIFNTVLRLRTKSGEWKWILAVGKVLERDKDGKPVRMLGIHQDITERKKLEDSLKKREEQLRTLINSTPDIICFKDGQGRWLEANEADLKLFQLENVDYHGKKDSDLTKYSEFYHDAFMTCEASDEIAWQKGTLSRSIEIIPKPDGSKRVYDVIKVPIFEEDASRKGLVVLGRDITEMKKVEEQLHHEREKLFVTLQSIGDGVITTDTEGRVTFINGVAEQLTGWSQQEAAGQPLSEVFHIINEKTGEPAENPVSKVLASGTIIGLANHTALIARDGTQRSIADSAAPILDAQGKVIGVVLVFRDVTEKKRMEEERLKIKKLESVGVLAGGIAHDFNNILTAILGNISLANIYIEKDHKARLLLQEAEKASLRARDLTQQLLTFAKGGEPVRETTSIKQVITDSADFVLHGSNVRCHYAISEDLWLVDIDAGQMSQVIQNLVLNARQAMPEGGEIKITCENIADITNETGLGLPGEKWIKITIADTGCGIPEKYLDKIFDPYFTTKQQGSGLGLAITHSIITKHDGHIFVQSKPGEGTTFTIYLPASATQISSDSVEEAQKPEKTVKATILIMDDEEMILDLAKEMLSLDGHEVLLAKDGKEAIAIFRERYHSDNPVDVIIMDLIIPGGMGGKEAIKKILKIDPNAKAIVSSGYSNDPVMANYHQYGFKAALGKPFKMARLQETIKSVLG
ncbi:MAG: PAS domain S-box protein [Deltaproteobacteria bacterium]